MVVPPAPRPGCGWRIPTPARPTAPGWPARSAPSSGGWRIPTPARPTASRAPPPPIRTTSILRSRHTRRFRSEGIEVSRSSVRALRRVAARRAAESAPRPPRSAGPLERDGADDVLEPPHGRQVLGRAPGSRARGARRARTTAGLISCASMPPDTVPCAARSWAGAAADQTPAARAAARPASAQPRPLRQRSPCRPATARTPPPRCGSRVPRLDPSVRAT